MDRIVALLDLDYFYAQAEQLRNPALNGKPVVIVMPSIRENSGAVATCNYEARAMKIRSGMPLVLAKKLATPETVFINAEKPYYEETSQKVFEVVDFYCDKIEQVSIDEAYLDLTNAQGYDKAEEICNKIRNSILVDTGLTCSIGVGPNKLLAKMACSVKKPNGFFSIHPLQADGFISKQKVGDLYGVGPKAEEIFKIHHVHFAADIRKHSKEELIQWFGAAKGAELHNFAFGVDERQIEINREKQQISRMITIKEDSNDYALIKPSVDFLAQMVFAETTKLRKRFKTASLVVITSTFETITKSKTKSAGIIDLKDLSELAEEMLKEFLSGSFSKIRRVGVRVSNFDEETSMQKKLFEF